ncbi:MAG: ABC transporter ATP-binding protein [Acidilobaceae archaeon]|nr:ABC transporter ATP-binding protein [Acidilobaceae archaeon]MCX8165183.1 ABC transporter ATP-binding protein [Acidilobaceae archaeon]MDW7974301.1 ABC transporter ATP-binding protein [Sulfolobales archaeon]
MGELVLERITKYYGQFKALDNVSLRINRGEIFTLLGPSGCGKSTTLRVIAGLELPEEGKVYLDGEDITLKKPYERSTAMMFQNYALWPHMTVFDNVAYGLKMKGYGREEIRKRVKWALELVGLSGLENRFPLQLSGGQQQRVALARAIVVEPKVLLLDEPLSNLDAKLRVRVREEIVTLQRKLGITMVYVTHDQEEAMSISDRIAIMDKGRVVQVGTPKEIYHKPTNFFVATFMGRSNVLRGVVKSVSDGLYRVALGKASLYGMAPGERPGIGEDVVVVIRHEAVRRALSGEETNVLEGTAERVSFIGLALQVKVRVEEGVSIIGYLRGDEEVEVGAPIRVAVSPEDVKIYPFSALED